MRFGAAMLHVCRQEASALYYVTVLFPRCLPAIYNPTQTRAFPSYFSLKSAICNVCSFVPLVYVAHAPIVLWLCMQLIWLCASHRFCVCMAMVVVVPVDNLNKVAGVKGVGA
jgi:hypothetical protein